MKRNVTLWAIQGLLALLFVFAGSMKLILPIQAMQGPIALPGAFLRFIGVAEVLGAIGLILPGALKVRRDLTPIAAVGLVLIMIGATTLTLIGMGVAPSFVPLTVGVLAAIVAMGRSAWAPGIAFIIHVANDEKAVGQLREQFQ